MLRHVGRLQRALGQALDGDRLSAADLQAIQPYSPALSAAWLFQRSMSLRVGQLAEGPVAGGSGASSSSPPSSSAAVAAGEAAAAAAGPRRRRPGGWLPPSHVNEVLAANFGVMRLLGDRVLRPFVQDSLQLGPLALTMGGMLLAAPLAILRVVGAVGPAVLLAWFGHFAALAAYTAGHALLGPLRGLAPPSWYALHRLLDALEYGSGGDYKYHAPSSPVTPPAWAAGAEQRGKQQQQQQRRQAVGDGPPAPPQVAIA